MTTTHTQLIDTLHQAKNEGILTSVTMFVRTDSEFQRLAMMLGKDPIADATQHGPDEARSTYYTEVSTEVQGSGALVTVIARTNDLVLTQDQARKEVADRAARPDLSSRWDTALPRA